MKEFRAFTGIRVREAHLVLEAGGQVIEYHLTPDQVLLGNASLSVEHETRVEHSSDAQRFAPRLREGDTELTFTVRYQRRQL